MRLRRCLKGDEKVLQIVLELQRRFIMKAHCKAALGIIAVAIMGIAPAASAQKIGKNLDEIVQLANKEGKVRVATSWEGKIIKVVTDGFAKKYPGRSFELERVSGLDSRERILNEAMAGLVENDLVNVSGELRAQYIKAGIMVGSIEWQKLFPDMEKFNFSPDGYFVAVGFSRYGIVYNPKLVTADRAPKKWDDCLDPYWKGKFAVYTRPRTFTGLYPGWGKEKSIDFATRLKNNQPVWTSDQTGTAVQVAVGEYQMGCGFPYHTFLNVLRRDPKADLKFVVPPDLPVHIGDAMAVMKGAKNPNTAILLAGYLLTPEGQDAFELYGRSSPFTKGSAAWKVLQQTKAKAIWGGWDFEGKQEAQAAKEIIQAWGFPKGRK
jgi:iron(III) transport system substrate-binding protein